MTKVRVAGFSVSLDGFGAGPEQSLENPLGSGRKGRSCRSSAWFFGTRFFQAMFGKSGGAEGVDDDYGRRSMEGFGAFILGRNMFGPVRGPWLDENWKGWWGEEPPYHAADLRADAPSARSDRDGRRHGSLHLRDRGDRSGAGTGQARGRGA